MMYFKTLITFSFSPFIFSELPYWWGRRRGRGNVGKCWGWDVLWGATVRTGNGRPGAGDQEHRGAVALKALSGLIISTLLHNHTCLSLPPSVVSLPVCALPLVLISCALFVASCLIHKLKAPIQSFSSLSHKLYEPSSFLLFTTWGKCLFFLF